MEFPGDLHVKVEVSLTNHTRERHLLLLTVFLLVIVLGLLEGPCHALILILRQRVVDELPLGLTQLLNMRFWHMIECYGQILIMTLVHNLFQKLSLEFLNIEVVRFLFLFLLINRGCQIFGSHRLSCIDDREGRFLLGGQDAIVGDLVKSLLTVLGHD